MSPMKDTTRDALTHLRTLELIDSAPLSLAPDPKLARAGIEDAVNLCHMLSRRAGWWNDLRSGGPIDPENPLVFAQKLLLIHSEVSEMMEGNRKSKMDEHLPHRPNDEVEAADAVIRIFDLAGAKGWDLAGAIIEKLSYNAQRADHKPENRRTEGGKAY